LKNKILNRKLLNKQSNETSPVLMTQRRQKIKENLKAQMNYIKEFFRRDAKSDHVRYDSILTHPLTYVFAACMALVMYYDYLNTDHFNKISSKVAKIPEQIINIGDIMLASGLDLAESMNAKPDLSSFEKWV